MLTSVPTAINRSMRQVVLRHANSYDVVIARKRVTRVEKDGAGDPSEMGGAPTLGGMGVLRSEDEAEFEYVPLGPAKVLSSAPFSPMDLNDPASATLAEQQKEALIECVAAPGTPEYFEAQNNDLLMMDLGLGVIMAFEVAVLESRVNVPPYTRRYVLNPRDDLNYLEPFEG